MRTPGRIFIRILVLIVAAYIGVCTLLFFMQERLIFHPQKLPADYLFQFEYPFEEFTATTPDNQSLHGILFKSDSSRGLIFYLHGNAGSLASWGEAAYPYVKLGYDVFMPDYRGYGKSTGRISDEQTFYSDMQLCYDQMMRRYPENKIVIIGYSIGTATAAFLASVNRPRMLMLQAPYYSLTGLALDHYPFIPPFLIKYPFETNRYIASTSAPVYIFHGDQDEIIPVEESYRLEKHLKPTDQLFILKGQSHNGMNRNPEYLKLADRVLSGYN
jgi:uncharacterized protein